MKKFKKRIEKALEKSFWEIEVIDETEHWWNQEHWKVKRTKTAHDISLWIIFMANEENERYVDKVIAYTIFPKNRLSIENKVGELCMRKGNFDDNLWNFISEIEGWYMQ